MCAHRDFLWRSPGCIEANDWIFSRSAGKVSIGYRRPHRRQRHARETALNPGVWAYRIVRWSLAGVFLTAGAQKMLRPEALALIIRDYGLLPQAWALPVAAVLPVLEVAAAVGLIFDVRGSLALITGLLVVFAGLLGYGIFMGLDIDCGCFGPGDPEGAVYHGLRPALYRDLALIAGAAFVYWWRYRRYAAPVRIAALLKFGRTEKEMQG
jgi:uncharacterized membrane protein YphA (DoxX/SURF4 family)